MVDLILQPQEDFLKDEIRCGYTVSRKMKEVWAVELDLLNQIDRVCKKYKLKYFMYAGSLLGAVRHKGFIPWDDDIDICMLRNDYDKLIEVAAIEFKDPYVLQSFYTANGYTYGHAQIRNTQTTCILKSNIGQKILFNQGIFLDIFVLDGVVDNPKKLAKQKKRVDFLKKIIRYKSKAVNIQSKKQKIANLIFKVFPHDYRYYCRKLDDIFRKYSVDECENVAPLNFIFETTKRIHSKHIYDETVYLDFEFVKVPCPKGYDQFLSRRYGDYMKPAKLPTTHGESILDTDHPDSFYLQKFATKSK